MKFCYVVKTEDIKGTIEEANKNGGLAYEASNELFDIIAKKGFYLERSYAEEHPEFKQIIPCFTINDINSDTMLFYSRKNTHTDQRLANRITPIFGGHIDPHDYEVIDHPIVISTDMELPNVCSNALRREAKEETGIIIKNEYPSDFPIFEGFIYDKNDAVGSVHLGIWFSIYVDINNGLAKSIDDKPEIQDVIIVDTESLIDFYDLNKNDLEGWAKIVMNDKIKCIKTMESTEDVKK